MIDLYGNYFMQSLLAQLEKQVRLRVIDNINGFNQVATNLRGTHVLQTLIKHMNSREEFD